MTRKKWLFYCMVPAVLQLGLLLPVVAQASHSPPVFGTYVVEDVVLSPGADVSQLNIAWQTTEADEDNVVCVVIAEKRSIQAGGKNFPKDFLKIKGKVFGSWFNKKRPRKAPIKAEGTSTDLGLDEDGNPVYVDEYDTALYPCEVTVTGLKPKTKYVYVLGDGEGNWSDVYTYTTRNPKRYGMFYIGDPQIGASGPRDFSRSTEGKPYIAETYLVRIYTLTDEDLIAELVDAYSGETLNSENYPELPDIDNVVTAIDDLYQLFYDEYSAEGAETDLADLAAADAEIAAGLLELISERSAEQLEAVLDDGDGWAQTLEIMDEEFSKAAYIISGGDQVNTTKEVEYSAFFTPSELTSIPFAPTVGNHDPGENYDYHFNLPNESSEYGVGESGGDYYFTYGDALVMMLNIQPTASEYPKSPPPGPPPGGGTPGPPPSQSCDIDSEEDFLADIYDLENSCTTDEDGVETCIDELADFKISLEGHEAFMQAAIDANPHARWKIVVWHQSIYSAGNHAADSEIRAIRYFFTPVLDALDIDLVLMAHDHVYTRSYQMLGDDPQTEQIVGCKDQVINPTGTLYVTGSTSSGSKYYSLNCAYDVDEGETPDAYFEYVAYADDMVRTDDNGTPDDETDDVDSELRSFSYIDVDANNLSISTYGYDPDDADVLFLIDSYSILKLDKKPGHGHPWMK